MGRNTHKLLGLTPVFQNGGYINPPPEKRQHRDPYGDWWDKQERRNFGEPVHEDNDILGMFSPYDYTHVSARKAFFQLGCFAATVVGLCGIVSIYYEDTPAVPRTFPGGLDRELGGSGTLLVRKYHEIRATVIQRWLKVYRHLVMKQNDQVKVHTVARSSFIAILYVTLLSAIHDCSSLNRGQR